MPCLYGAASGIAETTFSSPRWNTGKGMSYRDQVIEKIKKQYPYLAKEFAVKRIGLFGSVARQTDNPESDIDIVVEFSKPVGLKFMSFVEYIEKLFGKRVDVLTKDGIKNIRVETVSSEIEKNIIYV